jgi:putative nucleotide binding protein
MVAKDDYVIVLDFLPSGRPGDRKSEPLAQTVGEKFFNLLEIVIKEESSLKPGDRIYVGVDKRDQVKYIRSRIEYKDLTNFSRTELEQVLKDLISKDEKRFVEFFNKAGPVTTRLHSLELLPGVGKRHMWDILKVRREKPFESLDDLRARVAMLPDPKKMIARRVMDELEGKDRHRLFVAAGML